MQKSAGVIGLDLKVNGKDYKRQIQQFGNYGSSQLENTFSNTFRSIGKMAIAAFSIKAITDFTASCLKLGSDLVEVQNVVDVSFPRMTAQVDAFAKSAITNFGMSELAAKKFMGSFGAMSRAYGFNEAKAEEMSETLTALVGDVSSFYNIDQEDAYAKLSAVFTSETEALKHLGVVMTQNALDEYALANAYGKTTTKMTEQEKVALRYAFVQDQLKLATGDFIRTQDSWANQTRVLSLRFDQLKASLGKGLIAVFTPIVKGINWVLANLQPLADSFASLIEMLTGTPASSGGGALADTAGDISGALDSADGLSNGLADAGNAGSAAAKKIQKAFSKVDTINKLDFKEDSDSGSGGGSGGSGGSSGSVADAVDFPKASEQANVFEGMMSGIIAEFKRLSEIFKSGFSIGFGDSFKNIERLKDYISSISESLKLIFLSPEVTGAAKKWVDITVFTLGEVTGSAASIGITLATLLVGSVSEYLRSNTNFIKDTIVNWFDISGRIQTIIGNFSVAVADIISVFASSQFVEIGSNIIQAIVNGAMNTVTLIGNIGLSIIETLCKPIIDNKDSIKTAISEMFAPLVDITSVIASAFTGWQSFTNIVGLLAGAFVGLKVGAGVFSILTTGLSVAGGIFQGVVSFLSPLLTGIQYLFVLFQNGIGITGLLNTALAGVSGVISTMVSPIALISAGLASLAAGFVYLYTTSENFRNDINSIFADIVDNVGGAISGLVAIIQTLWTDGIAPIIESIAAGIAYLWDNGLSAFIANVSAFILNMINGIMSIWNNALNPLINFLMTIFLPIFTTIFDAVLAVAIPIIEKIMEYVNLFMGVLNDVIALLNEHVLPIFKVVFDGLSQAVSAFWDFVSPVFYWFMDILGQVVAFALDFFLAPLDIAFQTIVSIIQDIVDPIAKVFDGIKQTFQGIIDFVTGIFTGDWKKAWQGIKDIFSGMWNSLSGIVETVWKTITGLFSKGGQIFSGVVDGIADAFKRIVNCIIDGINRVIAWPFNKINSFLNTIKDIDIPVIGQPFYGLWGYNPITVPQLPMLAQGGYVGPNQPQLAMIGDNKRYGEIVAPENKMIDMINTALQMQKENGSVSGLDDIIILIKELIKAVQGLVLKVDIDIRKLSILLEQAQRERLMIGG